MMVPFGWAAAFHSSTDAGTFFSGCGGISTRVWIGGCMRAGIRADISEGYDDESAGSTDSKHLNGQKEDSAQVAEAVTEPQEVIKKETKEASKEPAKSSAEPAEAAEEAAVAIKEDIKVEATEPAETTKQMIKVEPAENTNQTIKVEAAEPTEVTQEIAKVEDDEESAEGTKNTVKVE
ncbi:uncharacterized protein N7515_004834 [Penicillium bovifimosum]|uniref:Uncharacterized protein n=1 Tax=Penicillium bovifimosum TaxID=126998 RepID=A0A9W9L3V8_9EURO|nr:uncharacterized protein N7515_004834 [Penicillium bovifimosum]KAJ5135556.1 hypothetical protein N7515_004834 [Penicillium bovifimosum]